MDPCNEVDEPTYGTGFRAPTVPIGETIRKKKRDFLESFERPPFIGQVDTFVYDQFIRKKNCISGKFIRERKEQKRGCPNSDLIEKHGLTCESSPFEWFECFLLNYLL